MTASYSFSAALRNCASRVDGPTNNTNTPVANGSSVPVCPMRRTPIVLRTRATTSCEVIPAGLSMMSAPFMTVILTLCVSVCPLWLNGGDLTKQKEDNQHETETETKTAGPRVGAARSVAGACACVSTRGEVASRQAALGRRVA